MNVQKQFPLTSIIDIIYDEADNPVEFKLVFQKNILILEAHNVGSCKQWVENIQKGINTHNHTYICNCIAL